MKSKKIVQTNAAPQAIGAYSQAVSYENLLFTSGQIPLVSSTGMIISDNIKEQIIQVLDNIGITRKPPFPEGNKVLSGNLELLKPVKKMGTKYIEV